MDNWRKHAACDGIPTAVFFPTQGDTGTLRTAKAICARCPVRQVCLDDALEYEQRSGTYPFGVFGGTSGDERRLMKRQSYLGQIRVCVVCRKNYSPRAGRQVTCGERSCITAHRNNKPETKERKRIAEQARRDRIRAA